MCLPIKHTTWKVIWKILISRDFSTHPYPSVKAAKTRSYQIDVYGKELRRDRVWLCECKYTKTAMNLKQVHKLEQAAEAVKQEAAEAGRRVPEIQMWLVSTGGFQQEVLDYVNDRDDIYASDYEGINGIFQCYGGNYRIPIFEHQG